MSLGKDVLGRNCLWSVYFMHIHSHLNYGLLAWGSMISNTQMKELCNVQLHCAELIMKASDIDLVTSMRLHKIMPLESHDTDMLM